MTNIFFNPSNNVNQSAFKIFAEAAVEAIAMQEKARLIMVNDQFCEMFGYSRKEIIGKETINFLIASESRVLATEQIAVHNHDTYEAIGIRKNGIHFHLEIRTKKIKWQDRQVKVFSLLDATRIIKTRQELQNSKINFRQLFEASNDAIIIHNLSGKIFDVNLRACKMLGHTRNQLESRQISDLHPQEELEKIKNAFKQTRSDGHSCFETRLITAKGNIVDVEISASIIDHSKGLVQGIVRDITQHKKNIEHQHQSDKLHAIGELAGGIAHDFNNHLVAIRGFAELLVDDLPEGEQKIFAKRIVTVSKKATNLTKQILNFSRRGSYCSESVDIKQKIEDTATFLQHSIDKRITIAMDFNCQEALVKGDPTQLENMLLNIGINARDAMPNGGMLSFSCDEVTIDSSFPQKFPDEVNPGKYVKICIEDTGEGIDPKIRQNIFDPFFTTKKQGEGTGMGLSAAYGIIKGHHGMVKVYSEINQGTTFEIFLPLAENAQKIEPEDSKKNLIKGSGNILVIDDDEENLCFMETSLKRLGYKVSVYKDSVAAIDFYKKSWQQLDLVILDFIMPKLSGEEVSYALKKINNNVTIIITSGYSMNSLVKGILNQGAVGFLHKPFGSETLSIKVAEALQQA